MICPDASTSAASAAAPFAFGRDTFAFRNELVWEYRVDARTGRMITRRAEPAPTFALRCFMMVRVARQFKFHARFEPERPRVGEGACRRLVSAVVRRSPRRSSAPGDRVCIPGFLGLRELSTTHEAMMKRILGGAWRSYFLPSHWRMVFPFSRTHQASAATSLLAAVQAGLLPIVHVIRFPQLTINHGLLLFAAEQADEAVAFLAYDPNSPDAPVRLGYHREARTFDLPPNRYWAGGRVDVFEIYRGWL